MWKIIAWILLEFFFFDTSTWNCSHLPKQSCDFQDLSKNPECLSSASNFSAASLPSNSEADVRQHCTGGQKKLQMQDVRLKKSCWRNSVGQAASVKGTNQIMFRFGTILQFVSCIGVFDLRFCSDSMRFVWLQVRNERRYW